MSEKMKFDVIVVSKDRYPLLFKQVHRIQKRCPHEKIIVIDSTKIIPKMAYDFYRDNGIDFYHTPDAKLGYARQKGLLAVTTPYLLMLDDDIIFSRGLAEELHREMIRYGATVFAMSPVIIFGNDKDIMSVYTRRKKDSVGCSGGCCMLSTQTTLHIGGFNTQINRGEDAELFNRARFKKYTWIRKHGLYVRHPGTNVEFIFRSWRNREGKLTGIAYGFDSYHGMIIKRIRSILVHILGLVKHRKFKATMYFICNDFIAIIAFIRGIIGGKEYALHKKKII